MIIEKASPKFINEIVSSFIASFSDWGATSARKYLTQTYEACPDCCLVAINDNREVMGAIFCKISPYNKGKMLLVESLQIKKEHRNQKVGTRLMREIGKIAKKKRIAHIGLMSSKLSKYPFCWFQELGFKETGWVEMAVQTENLKTT